MRYSAVIVQADLSPADTGTTRHLPFRTIRVPVVGVETTQEIPGGYIEARFRIPTPCASRIGIEALRSDYPAWIYDGSHPIFYGVIRKATRQHSTGETSVELDGAWKLLARTMMREVWSDGDLTKLQVAPGSVKNGSVDVSANGKLSIGFAKGASFDSGDYIAADYFLFGEPTGTRDAKRIEGWFVSASGGNYHEPGTIAFKIFGLDQPSGGTQSDQIHSATGAAPFTRYETATAAGGGQNTLDWASTTGYRCIRLGLYFTAGSTGALGKDRTITIDTFQLGTLEKNATFNKGPAAPPLPATQPGTFAYIYAREFFERRNQSLDIHPLLSNPSTSTTTSLVTDEMLTDAPPQVKISGFSMTDWAPPGEMVTALAATDGAYVGMWAPALPTLTASIYAANTTSQYWYWRPPRLVWRQWSDPSEPDYYARLMRGAVWEPDGQEDQLASDIYVNYTSRRGRSVSAYTQDAVAENWTYQQGAYSAVDVTIDPPVDLKTAQALGAQYADARRQPALSGTLTIYGDRPGALEDPGGARRLKLSTLRPGVIRIPEADQYGAGRVTRIEYRARTDNDAEMAILSVNSPAGEQFDRRMAETSRRLERTRRR